MRWMSWREDILSPQGDEERRKEEERGGVGSEAARGRNSGWEGRPWKAADVPGSK